MFAPPRGMKPTGFSPLEGLTSWLGLPITWGRDLPIVSSNVADKGNVSAFLQIQK